MDSICILELQPCIWLPSSGLPQGPRQAARRREVNAKGDSALKSQFPLDRLLGSPTECITLPEANHKDTADKSVLQSRSQCAQLKIGANKEEVRSERSRNAAGGSQPVSAFGKM